jgi:sugar transferase (PEP-CTERM/EpsH1 system associated)
VSPGAATADAAASGRPLPPLVLHVLYRFATGGLENGVVNLINHMPPGAFRHAVLALDTVDPAFARRVTREGVALHALNKPPGHAYRLYPEVWRLMRRWRPAIVHTRNLAALELQVPAWLARVPVRIHGEHGRDVEDLDGNDRRLQWVRRAHAALVQRHVVVSRDLERYLVQRVGIDATRVEQIYNGVDTARFRPAPPGAELVPGCPFDPARHWIVGTVGRLQAVKNQTLLLQAFLRALELDPAMRSSARLAIVGSGALRAPLDELVDQAQAGALVWMPGERADVPHLMQGLHAFVLPSRAEGVSNTVLEAMACGLPVLATAVGGNVELVQPERTGLLVPSQDVESMARALVRMHADRGAAAAWGRAARQVIESRFSLQVMVSRYEAVYREALVRRRVPAGGS